ncbi:hypothetical protein TNCV_4799081 [Trichonephila clavipes]|nr:hypothetical protein TNCV_4799081 [Trichonephila clavipes]
MPGPCVWSVPAGGNARDGPRLARCPCQNDPPWLTRDNRILHNEKITRVPLDCDTRTHLKKVSPEGCDVFAEETVTPLTYQRWLGKFRLGDFSLNDEPRSGMPSDVSDEMRRFMIRTNTT